MGLTAYLIILAIGAYTGWTIYYMYNKKKHKQGCHCSGGCTGSSCSCYQDKVKLSSYDFAQDQATKQSSELKFKQK